MTETLIKPGENGRFDSGTMIDANTVCGVREGAQYRDMCPKCEMSIILHCDRCKIQVTGCMCTEVDRFGPEEAFFRMSDRIGERQAKQRLKKMGLWTPEGHD